MLRKIYVELVAIREELHSIRCAMEPNDFVPEDSDGIRCGGKSTIEDQNI